MRLVSARVVLFAIVAIAACRADDGDEPSSSLNRLNPMAVSSDAWSLFDRSLSTGYVPAGKPVTVELARGEHVNALKVRGGVPYTLSVTGFANVDLSTLSTDWHMFTPTSATTNPLIVKLDGEGTAAVPELELWGTANNDDVTFAATEQTQSLTPGACASFSVAIPRSPAMFHRALSRLRGQGRPAHVRALSRNQCGARHRWLHGCAATWSSRDLREQIDTEELQLGANTVRLCAPSAATDTVAISNVRIVELDDGIRRVESSSTDGDKTVLHLNRLIAPDALVTSETVGAPSCSSSVSICSRRSRDFMSPRSHEPPMAGAALIARESTNVRRTPLAS